MSARRNGEPNGKGSKFDYPSDHGKWMRKATWREDDDDLITTARRGTQRALQLFRVKHA